MNKTIEDKVKEIEQLPLDEVQEELPNVIPVDLEEADDFVNDMNNMTKEELEEENLTSVSQI